MIKVFQAEEMCYEVLNVATNKERSCKHDKELSSIFRTNKQCLEYCSTTSNEDVIMYIF